MSRKLPKPPVIHKPIGICGIIPKAIQEVAIELGLSVNRIASMERQLQEQGKMTRMYVKEYDKSCVILLTDDPSVREQFRQSLPP